MAFLLPDFMLWSMTTLGRAVQHKVYFQLLSDKLTILILATKFN